MDVTRRTTDYHSVPPPPSADPARHLEMEEIICCRCRRRLTGLGVGHVGQDLEGLGLGAGAATAPVVQLLILLSELDRLIDRGGAVHQPLVT